MKLIKCYIENFGVLSKQTFNFKDGLNSILKDNGTGKTTLSVFIKSMFYGLSSTTSKDIEKNERLKYFPWQGGKYGGNLTFTVGDKTYRIERFFSDKANRDSFKLFDVKTNTESKDFSKKLGEELFLIDSDAYEKSIFFPQKDVSLDINDSLRGKLTNLVEKNNDLNDCDKVLKVLEDARKKYLMKSKNKGLLPDCENKISNLKIEIEKRLLLNKQISDDQSELNNYKEKLALATSDLHKVKENIVIANQEKLMQNNIEHLQKLETDIISLDNEVKRLNKFFEKHHPTSEEIDLSKKLLDDIKNIEMQLDNLPPSNEKEIIALKSKLENTKSEQLDDLFNDVLRLNKFVAQLENIELNDSKPVFWENDIPSKDEIINNLMLANKIKANGILINEEKPKYNYLGIITSGIISLLFITSGIILFSFTQVVAIICLVLGIISLFIVFFFIVKNLITKNKVIDTKQLEKENCNLAKQIKSFLLLYYKDINHPFDFYLNDMLSKLDQYQDYKSKEATIKATKEKLNNEIKLLDDKLSSILGKNENYFDALSNLKECFKNLNRLESEEITTQEKIKLLNERLKTKRRALNDLIVFYPLEHDDYKVNINAIEDNLKNFNIYSEQLKTKILEAEEFKKNKKLNNYQFKNFDLNLLLDSETNLTEIINELNKQIVSLEKDIKLFQEQYDEIYELEENLSYNEELMKEYTHKVQIYDLTAKYITEARTNLSTQYLSAMENNFQKYKNMILSTDNKFSINVDLNVMVEEFGENKELSFLSEGYKDIINFCLRCSLIETLFTNTIPFIILDDPFTNLDNEKLILINSILTRLSKKYQIIYMICHDSRNI